jgi:nitrogen regulatory protein PII
MKIVIAFIQPFMARDVMRALHGVPGLTGATFTDVKGFGRGRPTESPTAEVLLGTAQRIRIEVAVPENLEEEVVHAIREAAHTGNRGVGKIYVLPVDRAVRIATGEEGNAAV